MQTESANQQNCSQTISTTGLDYCDQDMLSEKFKDLPKVAKENASTYLSNDPYPHIVFDDFFDVDFLSLVEATFPNLKADPTTQEFNNQAEVKLGSRRGDAQQSKAITELLRYLNSHSFVDFLQKLTGISEPLIVDPHFCGGGMHEVKRGGLLKLHADYCKHPETKLDRRLNLLIYLNKDWKTDFGGDLELWDKELKACGKKISPVFNRMVVFATTDFTYHGHPDPLLCPPEISRKSLALYYFSNGRPCSELRPSHIASKSTIFVKRPLENFRESQAVVKTLARNLLPPLLYRLLIQTKHRLQKPGT
ncbi:2OG-Fe(II) oxygenase [Synechococcus sp. W4D4]|uniref:2OG-Fe(II) oxygenase n=1 Tax=Synechococcus sp. W4D4 TaxID=3392294 RepID=UPI0039EAB83E